MVSVNRIAGLIGWVAALGALTAGATTGRAQASPYLPLDHPAYAYVDALIERGQLPTLWRLERPYRVRQLREALHADTSTYTTAVATWRNALEVALTSGVHADTSARHEPRAFASVEPFVTAQTSAQREIMLADSVSGVYPGFFMIGGMQTRRLVLLGRLAFDRRLRDDPDYVGKKDRALIGRNLEGYASAEWAYGELFFGRTGRSWGPPRLRGLQIGDATYGYDHLYARLGSSRVQISSLIAKLDDWHFGADSVATRYLAAHRLAVRFLGVEIAGTETMVFGGVGRGFELAYANPLTVYHITQYNEGQLGNVNVGLEASARLGRWGIVAAHGMLDDLQIDDCGPNCEEPPSYGLTLSWDGLPTVGDQTLFASYTALTNLAYRTPAPFETYDFLGVGLGHAFTDYDEVRAGVELSLVPAVVLRPYVARRRQGEGTFPFPAPAEYATTPTIFAGTVMTTTRLGATIRGLAMRNVGIDADVGYNRVSNAYHQEGRRLGGVEGRVILRYAGSSIRW